MLVIGERINATRSPIKKAIAERDAAFIKKEALRQVEAGAGMIDVNAGSDPKREVENLVWLVETVQQAVGVPLCVDSPNAAALEAAASAAEKTPLINSATAEDGRLEPVLAVAQKRSAPLVALLMDSMGMPAGVEKRLAVLGKIVAAAQRRSIPVERIYVDPLIQPVCTQPSEAPAVVEAVRKIRGSYPGIHTVCGLSNVSFGMPGRALLNRTFLIMMMGAGLDSVIMDPMEPGTMAALFAMEALLGRDDYCMNYITASRKGRLS